MALTPKQTHGLRRLACAALALAGPACAASQTYDVRAFGAKGDGFTPDTPAVNEAIRSANAAGGGTVEFAAGSYLCGSIHLRSNVELHLGPGSTIVASANSQAYDTPEGNEWGDSLRYQDAGHSHWHNSLIWGEDLAGVSITGPGRILGAGLNRGYDSDHSEQRVGNKAIALKNCRNVTLRDFTIEHGGWFGILATGVDNLVIDGLRIDTNRDGMDVDCCRNVRISNCSVNSPLDDGICLKSSFGLGVARATEDVTISDCLVSGFDEGTLLDATYRHTPQTYPEPTGRIKLGTESNGGFKRITITNCVFECSRGLAIESVDGAVIEDVTVSNLSMHQIFGAPVFVRLGGRMRGPPGTPIGSIRRVRVGNLVASGVEAGQGILVSGLAGHPVEDLALADIRIDFAGGGTQADAARDVPELEHDYPEPGNFGVTPSWGLYVRHASGFSAHHVDLRAVADDGRTPVALDDVSGARFEHVDTAPAAGAKIFSIKNVEQFSVQACPGVPDTVRDKTVGPERL